MLINSLPGGKKRIAVAMSGGVDSSVAAYLLSQAGHDLVGFTAWTLNGPGKCCNDALVNAGRVCEMLNIPYDTVDLRAEFTHYVMDYYRNSYEEGLTPNPCVECNRYVKWEKLVAYAREALGADYVATGHYAQIDRESGRSRLFRSRDGRKDQTYMMARVYPSDLEYALFPLGHMIKPEVVEIARQANLPTAYSKESQDICFVLNGHADYMKGILGVKKGQFVDYETGEVMGEHEGYYHYTLGQRKGVKVAAGRPVYVVRIDPKTGTVYLGDKRHIETQMLTVLETQWLHPEHEDPGNFPQEVAVKIRYNSEPCLATLYPMIGYPSALRVILHEPQIAVTPGQIAAFYDTNYCELLGGGYIERYLSQPAFDPERRQELPNLYCPPQLTPA